MLNLNPLKFIMPSPSWQFPQRTVNINCINSRFFCSSATAIKLPLSSLTAALAWRVEISRFHVFSYSWDFFFLFFPLFSRLRDGTMSLTTKRRLSEIKSRFASSPAHFSLLIECKWERQREREKKAKKKGHCCLAFVRAPKLTPTPMRNMT